MKKLIYVFLFVASMTLFSPMTVGAITTTDYINKTIGSNVYILTDSVTSTDQLDDLLDDYNKEQNCEGSNSILGDPKDPDSVAWLLQLALNYMKIVGPMLVIILSSIDFIQVIVKSDDEAMHKAGKKLGLRLILAASLFFIPVLVQVMLELFGITANATCGLS